MNKKEKYILVFKSAKGFLNEIISSHSELNKSVIDRHLRHKPKIANIRDVNKRLIESLQNRSMMASVINFDEKENRLRPILCGYDPKAIVCKYPDATQLFTVFKKTFNIRNRRSKKNLWWKFAEGIITGSRFISSFKDESDFHRFIKMFACNKYTKAALPMLLSREIKGFGLALGCDFLKEIGYRDYPKPDTYLIKIFVRLNLSESKDPYEVYKSIVEMAGYAKEDAFTVDKIFWLIGSGKFYDNKSIGRNADKFIKFTKKKLAG